MLSPPRQVALLVAVVLLGAGGMTAGAQFATLAEYESTTGTVQTARIDTLPNGSLDPDLSNLTLAGERAYTPNVTYTYTVDGRTYTGGNVAHDTAVIMGDRAKLSAALGSVDAGTTTVYYDPANPSDAHLLQPLDFFPAGVLVLSGLLVATDALTPRSRVVAFLSSLVPIETLERLPGVTVAPTSYVDDPEAILTAQQTWAGTDPAPFRGSAGAAVWFLSLLLVFDLTLAYLWLSSPPYDLWVMVAGLVVVAGLARLGFKRVLG